MSGPSGSETTPSKDHEARTSIQDRLGSLFGGSNPNSARSSLDRSRPQTPFTGNNSQSNSKSAGEESTNSARTSLEMPVRVPTGTSTLAAVSSKRTSWTPPVVKWITDAIYSDTSAPPSRSSLDLREGNSNGSSPQRRSEELERDKQAVNKHPQPQLRVNGSTSQSSSGLDGQTSAALQQAISDEVFKIQRPPEARMAPAFEGQGHVQRHSIDGRPFRHPVLLDNLARASMPTSSITRPLQIQPSSLSSTGRPGQPSSSVLTQQPHIFASPTSTMFSGPGASLTRNDTRTSIDSLRSLTTRDRGIQTSAPTSMVPTSMGKWWFQEGNKAAVDELLGDDDKASTAQKEADHIRKKYLTPRLPLVFCHGLLGFDSVSLGASFAPLQITHWRGIKEVLEENGIELLITRVPATSGVEERAKVLEAKITEVYPGREVHLIGHSMGGLDIRWLASKIRPTAFKIRSVTTIGTPHRGSYFADYFLETLGKSRIPSLVSFLEYLPNGGGDGKAFEGLTRDAMKRFNEDVPDVEGIAYYSWGASCQPGLVDPFRWPHGVILEKEGPNDGLVSVSSAQWGKYMGTLDEVNHLDLVGWINAARYKFAEIAGKAINFKPASFYLEIAAKLAEEVEGLTWDDENNSEHEVLFESSSGSDDEEDGKAKRPAVHRSKSGRKHSSTKTAAGGPPPPPGVEGGVD
ncbi:related to triacylglycerol lipase [Serendipita indica DSM 11827]|uniref:Related to triacylglycerol lipase n=1 Tax=Serendipita indica (strain DSM 11827) TaxID=1109443 RepID=G4TB44_SERID|nr:related to triacylglycerol lipase [Serendipita indica DSM 11827]